MGLGIGNLYGGSSNYSTVALGIICPLLIILVERIIVQTPNNKITLLGRLILGGLIALVGSTLVTQIIFSSDIIKQQKLNRKQELTVILEKERAEINEQIKTGQRTVAGKDAIVDRFELNAQGLMQSIGKRTSSTAAGIIMAEQERIRDKSNRLTDINKELRELDVRIGSETDSQITKRSILDDLKAVEQITSPINVDDKKVLFFWNNQAHFFKSVLFFLILVFELLVVLIKAVSSKDEFDYQVYVEESNRLGINITRARLANQLENFRTEGSRNLVEKLFNKK